MKLTEQEIKEALEERYNKIANELNHKGGVNPTPYALGFRSAVKWIQEQDNNQNLWREVLCSERMPKPNTDTFFINGGELSLLQYQGQGYPLYDRAIDDTVPIYPHDSWLERLPNPPKTIKS